MLTKQFVAAGKSAEELVVKVIAVSQDNYGRILHRGKLDDFPCVERHRQALAATLRVPHYTDAPVAFGRSRLHRAGNGLIDCVELVVARHLLDDCAAGVLKNNEMAQQVEE